MLGRTIQNYRVEELLGEGGMGTVYRATDTVLKRSVAVKMLHGHLVRDISFMERFQNEAILTAQLNHPNVATLYNFLQTGYENLIIMEWVNGITLDAVLVRQGRLSKETAVGIVVQALDGLRHAHGKNILHRDIKAANLMITREGNIKLMDFGIARLEGSQRITRMDRVVGTLEYMAPELLNGSEPNVQSDLYAVGVLLYELLSGKMPFESTTEATLITSILNKKHTPVRQHLSDIPKPLEEILDKLLNKKPEKRYQSAIALRQALTSVVTPERTILSVFEKPSNASKPVIATQTMEKPQASPTRLIPPTTQVDTRPLLHRVKDSLLSLEGIILSGAILLAAIIITYGFNGSETLKQPGISVPGSVPVSGIETVVPEPQTPETPPITRESGPHPVSLRNHNPVNTAPEPVKAIELPPAETKKKSIEKKKTPPARNTESKKEVAEKKPEAEKEVTVPVASGSKTIEFRGGAIEVESAQMISSETAREGQTIYFRTTTPLISGGHVIIRSGAQIRGTVEKALGKSESKRPGLWIRLETVETAGGQTLPLLFKWSDTAFRPVEIKAGQVFRRVRVGKGSVRVL